MSAQTTLNSINQALQLINREEIKIKHHSSIVTELQPNWTTLTKNKLLRIRNAADTALKWGNGDNGKWNNAQSTIDATCRDLKLEELSLLDWNDLKPISAKFKEAWKTCAANGSSFSSLCRLDEEVSTFYLDPELNLAEVERIKAKCEAAEKDVLDTQQKLSNALKINAAGKSVESQAAYFEEISKACECHAKRWLLVLSTLCAALAGGGFYLIIWDKTPNSASNAEMLNHVAGRGLVITALFYFMRVAAQNYRANLHNQTINTHRAKALIIYSSLVKAVDDKNTQSIVLAKAADAIFGHQVSGHDASMSSKENTDLRVNVNTDKNP